MMSSDSSSASAIGQVRRVLLTGASGTLGLQLADYLHERNYRVRALVRQSDSASMTNPAFSMVAQWDAVRADKDAMEILLDGVDTVIHLASSSSKDPRQIADAHMIMPDRILSAGAKCGLRQFVLLSSIKAVAGECAQEPLRTDSTPEPNSEYGRFKYDAEQMVQSHESNNRVATWVLRLPMVYGLQAAGNFSLLQKSVRLGLPLPVATDNRRSLLFSLNLFACIDRLVRQQAAPGPNVLHVADPEAVSTAEFLRLIADAQGKPARGLRLSSSWAMRLQSVPFLGGLATRLLGSLELDVSSLARLGDWQLPYSTAEGVRLSLQRDPAREHRERAEQ